MTNSNGRTRIPDAFPPTVDVPAEEPRFARYERAIVAQFERRPWLPWFVFYAVEIGAVLYLASVLHDGFLLLSRHIDLIGK